MTNLRHIDTEQAPLEELLRRREASCPTGGAHEWNCLGGGFEVCLGCGTPSDPVAYQEVKKRFPKPA